VHYLVALVGIQEGIQPLKTSCSNVQKYGLRDPT